MSRILFVFLSVLFLFSLSETQSAESLERLKSRFKRGVDYYRDGTFTISRLTKQPLSNNKTLIRGMLTNDSSRRAVSVQLEITCYNEAGDFLGSQLVDVNYLGSRQGQTFQARFRERADQIALFEASVQDAIWDDF